MISIELIILIAILIGIVGILVVQIRLKKMGIEENQSTPTPRLIDGIKADLHRVTHKLSLSIEQLETRERIATQQLTEINDLLKIKKGSEKITEIVLDTLIGDKLPNDIYRREYTLSNGSKLDVALVLKNDIVPIETDFPLDSYRKLFKASEKDIDRLKKGFFQEIKSKIDNFADKYIESKIDDIKFGIIYIPSEEIYYEVLTQTELTEYAQKKMIYLTSPQTLSSLLGLILAILQDRKIRQNLEDVSKILNSIKQSMSNFGKNLETLDKAIHSITDLSKSLQDEYERIDKTICTAIQKSVVS